MESPSAQESPLIVAQEDSSSLDQREQSSSSLAGKTVPNAQSEDTVVQEETTNQESLGRFNEADSSDIEISSRLSNRQLDDSARIPGDLRVPECSSDSMDDPQNPEEPSGSDQHFDSSTSNLLLGEKVLEDMESVMYDENLFTDDALATSSSESTPSRKRPAAGDFLPINAEIKRHGVEISEEHAKQLKNDVRRLSPVLVSLRERTLGEISLTSDSGLFEEEDQALRLEIIEENLSQDSAECPIQTFESPALPILSKAVLTTESTIEEAPFAARCENGTLDTLPNVPSSSTISESNEETKASLEIAVSRTENNQTPVECSREGASEEHPNSPLTSSLNASSTPNERSNVQRELVIVLSRVDHDSPDTGTRNSVSTDQEASNQIIDRRSADEPGDVADEKTIGDGVLVVPLNASPKSDDESVATRFVEKCETRECHDEIVNDTSEARQQHEDCRGKVDRMASSDSVVLVGDICLSPRYHDNDQLRRKSPKVVIERTLEDGSSTKVATDQRIECSGESLLRANLECVRRTLEASLDDDDEEDEDENEDEEDGISASDSLAINEDNQRALTPDQVDDVARDHQESLDTETETETGSDNSEHVSITSRDCLEPTNHSSACPETDSTVSDEVPTDVITRLEPERPEAFTEDSAESLALATGARDEVRSDGSDSGLGSEIPGDPGPAPAPESDSETSFLDRIPDDILSDKEKVVNQLEAFVPDADATGIQHLQQQQQQQHQEIHHQQQQIPLPSFPAPPKSSLKRRLTDCMEGEPSPKRINTDDQMKKKRNIQFDAVTVYYFPRAQGFTCVPSQGGSTLGMSATHTHAERFSLTEHAAEQRRIHRARLAQLRTERAANCVTEAASSSEDPSDDTDEEPSDTEELDIDSYYFLQPVPTWQRRALLRAAGVRRIDAVEKDDCRDIRASREHCGCGCKGYCDPESCPCSRANVKCQVDRAGFPCGCSRDGCANSSGRIEFNPVRVRTHFIHTLMRLQLEKKQRDEDRTDHDLLVNNQIGRGPMREVPGMMGPSLGPMDHPNVITGDPVSCINAGGFTTLHYETHDPISASCPPGIIHAAREDSLDLYAIRDDCYQAEDVVDGGFSSQRKLHPEFGQAFQAFPGQQPAVSFPQSAYQDYQGYQTLASTSRSQFQPQFQAVPPANPAFTHYAYGQDPGVLQSPCQSHTPLPSHHPSVYETAFSQEDPSGNQQQYTNLNSVQPMNAVVQQMGKLEPFSELLAGRYSYYGDPEPQAIAVGYHNNLGAKIEPDKSQIVVEQPVETGGDDCDENFGEIIKKSMVETVSA